MSLILVNLFFAVVALAVGFVAGACLLGRRNLGGLESNEPEQDLDEQLERQQAMERATLASSRLKDLAHSMVSDVGAHSSRVDEITADLQSIDVNDVAAMGEGVLKALEGIVTANSELQDRLQKAEQQIEAQAEEIRAHESEARTDSLTCLNNRRAFDDEMNRRFAEWERNSTPFSLLILDIDHFKKFNDTHGHQAGDEVLRCAGQVLTEASRDMDLPCRYGGEEFAVVMPATVAHDGNNLVERVRTMVEAMDVEFEGETLHVTASIGLAEVGPDEDPAGLLKRADEALYASKDAGRNCGHWHTGETILPVTERLIEMQEEAPAAAEVETKFLDVLPNRTRFMEELRRRVAEATRTGTPLSVVGLAVDRLAEVERRFGMPGSLHLMDAVAEYLTASLREMDLVGRASDSSFVILLPGNTLEDAEIVVARTMKALDGSELPLGDTTHRISVHIGVVQNTPNDSAATMLERVEQILVDQVEVEEAIFD